PGVKEESVHLARFEKLDDLAEDSPAAAAWERLTAWREEVAILLEAARREKVIGSSLEGGIALTADAALDADRAATGFSGRAFADLFIVSELTEGASPAAAGDWQASAVYPGLRMRFVKAPGTRCDRCWKVTPEADDTGLCDRCRKVLSGLEPAAVAAPA
ncbi:MAG TPA: hypothetical protein VOA00_01940, partial [Thermoanaerobaculia bacterium]|nr:hypothetical protein [Thermoanaerobaculia bacterium]